MVSENWYTRGYWTATNILLSDTTDVQVLRNTLTNGQTGVYAYGTDNKVNGNSITGRHYDRYPSDWPPCTEEEEPCNYWDYGSWGILLYGDNNKGVRNTIKAYDVGAEVWGVNNKVINNTFVDCTKNIDNYGDETKVHPVKPF